MGNLKRKFSGWISSAILVFSPFLQADPPLVAIMDSPIFYNDPSIASAFDFETLHNTPFVHWQYGSSNLFDINQKLRRQFEHRLRILDWQNVWQKALRRLNLMDYLNLEQSRWSQPLVESVLNFQLNLFEAEQYLHGTQVASVAIHGQPNFRLINFPMLEPLPFFSGDEVHNFNGERHQRNLRDEFRQISRILQENSIRLVNVSIVSSDDFARKVAMLMRRSNGFNATFSDYLRVAHILIRIFVEEYHRFFSENPNTLFVLCAGNQGIRLDEDKSNLARIKLENVMVVGALVANGLPAQFSNYSPFYVDVLAPGQGIPSYLDSRFSGTSAAVPLIFHRLAHVVETMPRASVAELRRGFDNQAIQIVPAYAQGVIGGKVLREPDLTGSVVPYGDYIRDVYKLIERSLLSDINSGDCAIRLLAKKGNDLGNARTSE